MRDKEAIYRARINIELALARLDRLVFERKGEYIITDREDIDLFACDKEIENLIIDLKLDV